MSATYVSRSHTPSFKSTDQNVTDVLYSVTCSCGCWSASEVTAKEGRAAHMDHLQCGLRPSPMDKSELDLRWLVKP